MVLILHNIILRMLKGLTDRFKKKQDSESPGKSSTPRTPLSVNSLSQISDRLAGIGQGKNVKTVSLIVCLIFCAYFMADLFALMFEKYLPSPPVSVLASRVRGGITSRPMDYDIIVSRNLFSSKAPKKTGNDIDLDAEPVATTLPFQLVGTVIFHNPARSLAALQDKTENKMYPVRMGDEISDKAQVLSVEPRRVVFINNQARRKEFVEIPEDPSIKISTGTARTSAPSAGIAQVEENKFVVSRSEIDSQMANFNTLITQARAIPEMRGGQMVGFKLVQIQPGSFYEKIGMKTGDVIKAVNGEAITDAAKALSILQELKTQPSLDMKIERNGKDVNQNYDIR
jgi:general secretion pathway protein C